MFSVALLSVPVVGAITPGGNVVDERFIQTHNRHRLNLEARATSKKSSTKINSENNKNPELKTQKLGRKAKFKALLLDKNFEPENPKKLEELTDETCRWPIGHPYEEKFYFCGRKSMEKFPYCKLHVLYAFQPKNAKEEDQITDEDNPKFIEKKIKSA